MLKGVAMEQIIKLHEKLRVIKAKILWFIWGGLLYLSFLPMKYFGP